MIRILINLVLGPLIGGATVFNVFGLILAVTSGDFSNIAETAAISVTTPVLVIVGYLFGAVPALVTGITTAVLARKIPRRSMRLGLATGVGALASLLIVGWHAFTGLTPGVGTWRGLVLIGLGGAVAALACGALAELVERRPRAVAAKA